LFAQLHGPYWLCAGLAVRRALLLVVDAWIRWGETMIW
jgi:hypothetical protein